MIPGMDHLMGHRILDHGPVLQHISTELDAVFGVEAAQHPLVGLTPPAADVGLVEFAAQLGDVGGEVADDGRVLEEVVALGLAAAAVELLVAQVDVLPVGYLARGGHAARRHAVEVLEAREGGGAFEELGRAAGPGVGGQCGGGFGLVGARWGSRWSVGGGHGEMPKDGRWIMGTGSLL